MHRNVSAALEIGNPTVNRIVYRKHENLYFFYLNDGCFPQSRSGRENKQRSQLTSLFEFE